jgi:hypothetical protein
MAVLHFLEQMRFLTAPSLFFALFLMSGDSEEVGRPIQASAIRVHARPITADRFIIAIAPDLHLSVTGAWHLTSKNPDFGGLSALHASGGALTLVSDKGALVRLGVDPASEEWTGTVSPLPPKCGASTMKDDNDTESLVSDGQSGALWVGYEARNVICRIAGAAVGGSGVVAPAVMQHWASTSGPETMVRRRDGSFLVFQEKPVGLGGLGEVVAFSRDPTAKGSKSTVMHYRPPTGFLPVDAAELPDGRLLVLSRRFALPFQFTSRISLVPFDRVQPGKELKGPILARIDDPRITDNFEGLSIERLDDRLILWLVSDDNFMKAQRTILLRLEWKMPR